MIVMGDSKAKNRKTVGSHGLRGQTEYGDRQIDWCKEINLAITDPGLMYTPGDGIHRLVLVTARNQIDYVTISSRYRNEIKNS